MGDEMWEPLRRIREAAGLTGLQSCRQCLRHPLRETGSSAWAALCRTSPMTRIFWYWSGRASRNVWCRSALRPLSGRAWPMAASIPETRCTGRCAVLSGRSGCRPRAPSTRRAASTQPGLSADDKGAGAGPAYGGTGPSAGRTVPGEITEKSRRRKIRLFQTILQTDGL